MFRRLIAWLKRQTLIQQGLSCDKTRHQTSEITSPWDCNPFVRVLILLASLGATIRIGLWNAYSNSTEIVILSIILFVIAWLLMHLVIRGIGVSNNLLTLTMVCFVGNLLINKAISIAIKNPTLLDIPLADLLVPAALGPMLATMLISPRAGIFLVILLSIADTLFLGANSRMLTSSLLTGLAGVFYARNIRRRSDLLMAGVLIGLTGLICALLFGGVSVPTSIVPLVIQGVWASILGVATAFIVGFILPVFEWTFDRITDISWLELTDLNHPLLKQMTMEAPGTYHHSLMVGNLAEAAAEAIGANATKCRVLAYFHDIGKLTKPEYFIENCAPDLNPHLDLNPSMSALIIIAHVKEGVDLAIKQGLPKPIIDTIQQHHGTSTVYYFYRKALQQQEDAKVGSKILNMRLQDLPEIDESSFRYPGPIPQFKECALVSLADAIESASRNLRNPTSNLVDDLVKDIIKQRLEDGQLDDSELTLHDLRIVEERFAFTLKTMLHARIEYPDRKEKEEEDDSDSPLQYAKPSSTSNS